MNTDAPEKYLAQQALLTPEQKQLFGPYPANNRHERRKAAKLMRSKR